MSTSFSFVPVVARNQLKCSYPKKDAEPPKIEVEAGEPHDDAFDPTVYLLNVQVSLDGAFIAVSTSNYDVKIYSADNFAMVSQLKGHKGPVTDIKFSLVDAHILVSSSDDGTVIVWDVRSGAQSKVLRVNGQMCKSAAISSSLVVAGTNKGEIAFWDLNSESHYMLQDYFSEEVSQIMFNPVSPHILHAGSYDGLVVTMDVSAQVTDDAIIDVLNVGTSVAKMGLFGTESQFLYTMAPTEQLQVWNVVTSGKLLDFGFDLLQQLSGLISGVPLNYIIDCKYDAPNDKLLIFAGNFAGQIHIFACIPEDAAFHHLAQLNGHSAVVRSAWYDTNGTRALTAGEDSLLFQWASSQDPAPISSSSGRSPSNFASNNRSKPY